MLNLHVYTIARDLGFWWDIVYAKLIYSFYILHSKLMHSFLFKSNIWCVECIFEQTVADCSIETYHKM